jgi:NAD(P)H dehydrogenase (quinone)
MKHLIIYSHPNPKSFNHAILETYTLALAAGGHEVRVRDLYKLNFDPVLKARELAGFVKGKYPKDIKIEQTHVRWSEIITLIGPIWWGGFPANLRGYMERVFCLGFAYDKTPRGLLADKKIFSINTIGAPAKVYEDAGLFKAMDKLSDEIVFSFCAFKIIGHKYFSSVTTCSPAERENMLAEVERIAREIR